MATAVEKMIAFAETTLGWSDENNTVRTPDHTWYNDKFGNPDPSKYAWDWCDGWITYVAWKTGNEAAVVFEVKTMLSVLGALRKRRTVSRAFSYASVAALERKCRPR